MKYKIGNVINDDLLRFFITRDESILKNDLNIKVPDHITSIPPYTFSGVSKLKSIDLNNITSIGDYCFQSCSGLTSLNIPVSLKNFGSEAFLYCENIVNINYQGTLSDWVNIKFNSDDSNPLYIEGSKLFIDGVEPVNITLRDPSIGDYSFIHCDSLKTVNIAATVKKLGSSVFKYCHYITSITFERGLEEIGDHVFYNCNNLKTLTLPLSVSKIGDYGIAYCPNLTEVTFNYGAVELGDYMFYTCDKLSTIRFNDNYGIGDRFYIDGKIHNSKVKTIYLPSCIASMGTYAFDGCYNLTTLYYPGTRDSWVYKRHSLGWDAGSGITRVVCSNGTLYAPFENKLDDGTIIIPRT